MIKSTKYQLKNIIPSYIVFFLIVAGLELIGFAIKLITGYNSFEIGGPSLFMSAVFVFVVYICVYGENLRFLIQNGRTRKEAFISALMTIAATSLFTTAFCLIYDAVTNTGYGMTNDGSPVMTVSAFYRLAAGKSLSSSVSPADFLFPFIMLILFSVLGLFLAVLFARAGKVGRVFISAGVPIGFVIVFPISLESFPKLGDWIVSTFLSLMGFNSGNPYMGCLCMLVIAAVFSGIGFLITRGTRLR